VIALAVALALLQGGTSAPHTPPVVRYGITVRPETVTVGQHFEVLVRVRAPIGSTIIFPAAPDSGSSTEALDPRTVSTSDDTAAVEQSARYLLAAWDTGTVHPALDAVVVSMGETRRRIPLNGITVHVRSVLPADSALRVPKPARGVLEAAKPWWPWLVAALVALALLLLLLWWWLRRRRRGPGQGRRPCSCRPSLPSSRPEGDGDRPRSLPRLRAGSLPLGSGGRGRRSAAGRGLCRGAGHARDEVSVEVLAQEEQLIHG